MNKKWEKPYYTLKVSNGDQIKFDVTTSVSLGLKAKGIIIDEVIPFFKQKKINKILDFGAGALRHVFPFIRAGFEVCAVEFQEQFNNPICDKKLKTALRNSNFSKLVWPKDFINDNRKFDAAILSFVLQTMPKPDERELVLKLLKSKLKTDAYLLYMARYGQISKSMESRKVGDGYYMWPDRELHSFYTEFTTEITHKWMEKYNFKHIRSLSERGTDQVYLYAKGKATWV